MAVTSFVSFYAHRCPTEIAVHVQVWFEFMYQDSVPTVLYLMEYVIFCTCLCNAFICHVSKKASAIPCHDLFDLSSKHNSCKQRLAKFHLQRQKLFLNTRFNVMHFIYVSTIYARSY